MSTNVETIGNIIAKLRKEKNVTQEELAKFTQVSTQAVSKWENGGVPDTELLPKIADFFGVSIDTLFGRNITDYSDIENTLAKKIVKTTHKEKFELAFELCWVIERSICGSLLKFKGEGIKELREGLCENELRYSTIRDDNGFTSMGLAKRLPYFLIVPECADKDLAFFEGIDYVTFFKDFSDKAVFDSMVFLYKRDATKGFTPNLLVKNLGLAPEKAVEVIKIFSKYQILRNTQIEMDDVMQEIYTLDPTPSFYALLIFAREMIEPPNSFNYYQGGRTKPYLA
ncbi:MAG: helix-turn-helix domain-containing protein [Oscillospiraceae bacterium]|nr:helix-turn-helix domain-containing protein [Oscillospiraceae bacterium]